jgi:hypothetical protein
LQVHAILKPYNKLYNRWSGVIEPTNVGVAIRNDLFAASRKAWCRPLDRLGLKEARANVRKAHGDKHIPSGALDALFKAFDEMDASLWKVFGALFQSQLGYFSQFGDLNLRDANHPEGPHNEVSPAARLGRQECWVRLSAQMLVYRPEARCRPLPHQCRRRRQCRRL